MDIKKIANMCKSLGGKFSGQEKDFDCEFSPENKEARQKFWLFVEEELNKKGEKQE